MTADADFKDKIRSLHFRGVRSRTMTKTTIDQHDNGTVEVTEHHDDRVDVTIKPDTLQIDVRKD